MRNLLIHTVSDIQPPSLEERAEAAHGLATAEQHAHYLAAWPCLQTMEAAPPPVAVPVPTTLTVAAWNIERCKRVEDSAALLRRVGADVVLATEMDIGMARSGQRHTVRDLAAALGMGYVFGVEFVELGTGDSYETGLFVDVPNKSGLHGNAILSRFPLENPKVILLDDWGAWFTGAPKGDGQRRVGGRMAICADIRLANGPISFVSVHYESQSDAKGRQAQTQTLLDALSDGSCVVGGDLNTAAFTGQRQADILNIPARWEPCFDTLAAGGFDWRPCNTGAPTTRAAPGKPVDYPLKTLDWLFVRGVNAYGPAVHAAVSEQGAYLSDHELITTQVAL